MRRHIAAATVGGLLAGGAAGAWLGVPALTSAQTDTAPAEAPAAAEHHQAGPLERALDRLVEEGSLTAEQAEAVRQAVGEELPGRDRVEAVVGHLLRAAADALGMDPAGVGARLRDGATLAELAGEQGVAVDDLVDALVADARARIEAAAAEGRIDEDQATRLSDRVEERVTRFVEEGPRRSTGERARAAWRSRVRRARG